MTVAEAQAFIRATAGNENYEFGLRSVIDSRSRLGDLDYQENRVRLCYLRLAGPDGLEALVCGGEPCYCGHFCDRLRVVKVPHIG